MAVRGGFGVPRHTPAVLDKEEESKTLFIIKETSRIYVLVLIIGLVIAIISHFQSHVLLGCAARARAPHS